MKLNVKKLQQGNTIDFWGMQKGQYTPEYKNAVDAIANNPAMLSKLQTTLPQIKDKASFLNLTTDSLIGPVHKAITRVQKSTTPLPKHLVKYPTQNMGTQTVTSRQFIDVHKPEFDRRLASLDNDSTAAYTQMTAQMKTPRQVGTFGTNKSMNKANNPYLNSNNKSSFLIKRQQGGIINYLNHFIK